MIDSLTQTDLFELFVLRRRQRVPASDYLQAFRNFTAQIAALSTQISDYSEWFRILTYTHTRLNLLKPPTDRVEKKCADS